MTLTISFVVGGVLGFPFPGIYLLSDFPSRFLSVVKLPHFPFRGVGNSLWLGSGAGGGWGLLSLLVLFGCYLFTFRVFASSRHQAIMGGRFWDNQVSHWSSRNWDQLALQAHNLIICNTLLAGPMWRKEIRGSSSPSLCLISYSAPTDFINGLFSLSVKALWDGNIFSTSLSVSLLTFSTSSLGYLVRYTTSFAFFFSFSHSFWLPFLSRFSFPVLTSVLDYLVAIYGGGLRGGGVRKEVEVEVGALAHRLATQELAQHKD